MPKDPLDALRHITHVLYTKADAQCDKQAVEL